MNGYKTLYKETNLPSTHTEVTHSDWNGYLPGKMHKGCYHGQSCKIPGFQPWPAAHFILLCDSSELHNLWINFRCCKTIISTLRCVVHLRVQGRCLCWESAGHAGPKTQVQILTQHPRKSQIWWHAPQISMLGRQRQKGGQYLLSSWSDWISELHVQWVILSEKIHWRADKKAQRIKGASQASLTLWVQSSEHHECVG